MVAACLRLYHRKTSGNVVTYKNSECAEQCVASHVTGGWTVRCGGPPTLDHSTQMSLSVSHRRCTPPLIRIFLARIASRSAHSAAPLGTGHDAATKSNQALASYRPLALVRDLCSQCIGRVDACAPDRHSAVHNGLHRLVDIQFRVELRDEER